MGRLFLVEGGRNLSLAELASVFNVTQRTIQNWAGKLGMGAGRKAYDLVELTRFRVRELEETIVSLKAESSERVKTRKLTAEAELAELKLAEVKGSLVSMAVVREEWANAITKAKTKLLGLPDRLALELSHQSDPAVIKYRLSQVIDEALQELSDEGSDR